MIKNQVNTSVLEQAFALMRYNSYFLKLSQNEVKFNEKIESTRFLLNKKICKKTKDKIKLQILWFLLFFKDAESKNYKVILK